MSEEGEHEPDATKDNDSEYEWVVETEEVDLSSDEERELEEQHGNPREDDQRTPPLPQKRARSEEESDNGEPPHKQRAITSPPEKSPASPSQEIEETVYATQTQPSVHTTMTQQEPDDGALIETTQPTQSTTDMPTPPQHQPTGEELEEETDEEIVLTHQEQQPEQKVKTPQPPSHHQSQESTTQPEVELVGRLATTSEQPPLPAMIAEEDVQQCTQQQQPDRLHPKHGLQPTTQPTTVVPQQPENAVVGQQRGEALSVTDLQHQGRAVEEPSSSNLQPQLDAGSLPHEKEEKSGELDVENKAAHSQREQVKQVHHEEYQKDAPSPPDHTIPGNTPPQHGLDQVNRTPPPKLQGRKECVDLVSPANAKPTETTEQQQPPPDEDSDEDPAMIIYDDESNSLPRLPHHFRRSQQQQDIDIYYGDSGDEDEDTGTPGESKLPPRNDSDTEMESGMNEEEEEGIVKNNHNGESTQEEEEDAEEEDDLYGLAANELVEEEEDDGEMSGEQQRKGEEGSGDDLGYSPSGGSISTLGFDDPNTIQQDKAEERASNAERENEQASTIPQFKPEHQAQIDHFRTQIITENAERLKQTMDFAAQVEALTEQLAVHQQNTAADNTCKEIVTQQSAKIASLMADITRLKQEMQDKDAEIDCLRCGTHLQQTQADEISLLRKQVYELQDIQSKYSDQVDVAKRATQKYREVVHFKEQYFALEARHEAAKHQLKQLGKMQAERNFYKAEIEAWCEAFKTEPQDSKKTKSGRKRRKNNRSGCAVVVGQATSSSSGMSGELHSYHGARRAAVALYLQIMNELCSMKELHHTLNEQNNSSSQCILSLKEQCQQLRDKIEQLSTDNHTLKSENEEMNLQVVVKDIQYTTLLQSHQRAYRAWHDTTTTTDDSCPDESASSIDQKIEEAARKLQQENRVLQKQVASLQKSNETLQQLHKKSNVRHMMAEINILQQKLNVYKAAATPPDDDDQEGGPTDWLEIMSEML